MAENYLNLVNDVLRRTRQNTVSSVNENEYSTIVGAIVNDARRHVEDAWEWNHLKTTYTVPTVAGTEQYVLANSDNRIRFIDAQNTTNKTWMDHISQQEMRYRKLNNTSQSAPSAFSFEGLQASGVYRGDNLVEIWPIPDGVYSLEFNCVQREADLSAEGDETDLPKWPIVDMAVALVARERGEVDGQSVQEYFAIARKSLGIAIERDANLNPYDLVWEPT